MLRLCSVAGNMGLLVDLLHPPFFSIQDVLNASFPLSVIFSLVPPERLTNEDTTSDRENKDRIWPGLMRLGWRCQGWLPVTRWFSCKALLQERLLQGPSHSRGCQRFKRWSLMKAQSLWWRKQGSGAPLPKTFAKQAKQKWGRQWLPFSIMSKCCQSKPESHLWGKARCSRKHQWGEQTFTARVDCSSLSCPEQAARGGGYEKP